MRTLFSAQNDARRRSRHVTTMDGRGKGGSPSFAAGKGGRGKGGSSSGRVDAPLLNSWLSKATSADALLRLFAEHGSSMDSFHFGNLWNKLGKQLKSWSSQRVDASKLDELATTTATQIGKCGAQQLANIAAGAANVGLLKSASAATLFGAIANAAPAHVNSPRCEARHLANLAWGFATASQRAPSLFDLLASASAPRLQSDFNAQELAMTIWAFAKMEHGGVTREVASAARARADDLEAQSLATITLSLVKLDCKDGKALKALAKAARKRMTEFNAQDLDNVASAYARLGKPRWGARLTIAIADSGVARLQGNGNGNGSGGWQQQQQQQ